MDKSCVEVCPVDCIHFEEGSDKMLFIDPAECIDCGACQPACPVDAIFPEDDVPADQASFTDINSLWFSDPAAARAQVGGGAAPAPDTENATADAPATEDAVIVAPTATTETATEEEVAAEPDAAGDAPWGAYTTSFKFGEAGVEGKCGLCGTYVIKGGTRFRQKSVLCPDCVDRQEAASQPYGVTPGSR
jgi:NAD-dependent dihydropyrimidine dehydrogenase PreA subunit